MQLEKEVKKTFTANEVNLYLYKIIDLKYMVICEDWKLSYERGRII